MEHDARTLRRLAVEADADPRTVAARLRGEPIRTASVRERIDRVLAAHGLSPETLALAERGDR